MSLQDIRDWYDGKGEKKEISHEEMLKRLKEAGLPTKITSDVKKED